MISFGNNRLPDRFWAKVIVDKSGCWEWTAAKCRDGYGQFSLDRKAMGAHQASYRRLVGSIPEGMELDHLCRVRHCVNPGHLEPVTHAENMRRGVGGQYQLEKTHCPQGHPYSGDNLYLRRNGYRECRTCMRTNKKDKQRAKQISGNVSC